jgi:hypothetical protein
MGIRLKDRGRVQPLVTLHPKRAHRLGGDPELVVCLVGPALGPSGGFDLSTLALGGDVGMALALRELR